MSGRRCDIFARSFCFVPCLCPFVYCLLPANYRLVAANYGLVGANDSLPAANNSTMRHCVRQTTPENRRKGLFCLKSLLPEVHTCLSCRILLWFS
ncbi:hypothetical protein GCWU000325_00803 [Alloprevotella tannerae ATCC 51259]|uniref:Uncharacterized protein n=1 Tax=Alloprevotella tannerae ATCC 51259 TaxID=626522 RepID=C9LF22_9BACT|nr:hypothetical protein GCWU000325_00803 [Alloprevotella tannerae ATCC 51259]